MNSHGKISDSSGDLKKAAPVRIQAQSGEKMLQKVRPFEEEFGFGDYLKSEEEERCEALKSQARFVYRKSEPYYKGVARFHVAFLKKIENDVDLNEGKWRYDFMHQEDSGVCRRFLAQKTFMVRFRFHATATRSLFSNKGQRTEKKIKSDLRAYLNHYKPPVKRVLIMNITFNKNNRIPVFCDISQNLNDLIIPPTLTFEYIYQNFVNSDLEKDLTMAIEMAKKPKNQIRCNCKAEGKRCYENTDCACFKMNALLREFQVGKEGRPPTEFSSLKPIIFRHILDVTANYMGFSCSELCDCEGKCDNNTMMLVQKNLFPLEIYRDDMDMGFNIRTDVFIPAGTPVMDFCGEILEHEHLEPSHVDYAFRITEQNDNKKLDSLLEDNAMNFEEEYITWLKDLHSNKSFYINPMKYGNGGRMAAHSCCPNMEMVRVYQRSLSPAHMNMIMVTLEDIYPGTPLSIDYGAEYSKRLKNLCKCGTFACQNNKKTNEFKTMNPLSLACAIKEVHNLRMENFQKGVLEPLEIFSKQIEE